MTQNFHFSFKGLKHPNDPYQTKFDTKPLELYKTPFQEYPSHVGIFNSFLGKRQDVVFGNLFSMRTGILAAIAILVNFVGMFLSFLNTRKYSLCGYILGVLTHTTALDTFWGGLLCMTKDYYINFE